MFDTYQNRVLQVFDTYAGTVPELIEYIIEMWCEDYGIHVLPLLSRLQADPELGQNNAAILYEQYDRVPWGADLSYRGRTSTSVPRPWVSQGRWYTPLP